MAVWLISPKTVKLLVPAITVLSELLSIRTTGSFSADDVKASISSSALLKFRWVLLGKNFSITFLLVSNLFFPFNLSENLSKDSFKTPIPPIV